MGLSVAQGTITQPGSTGNQSTGGLSFQPVFVEFWWGDATADGSAADFALGYGVGISSSSRRASFMCGDDGTTNNGGAHYADRCIAIHIPNVFFDLKGSADMVSLNSDGFTLNWTTTDGTSRVIHYRAWGGTDISNVELLTCAAKTTSGTQAYTTSFQPDAILLWGAYRTTTTGNGTGWQAWKMGACDGTSQWVTVASNRNAISASQAHRRQNSTNVVGQLSSSSGTAVVDYEAAFSSFNATDFTLNFGTVDGTAWSFFALVLKGTAQFKALVFNGNTSNGAQAVTAGFTGSGVLFGGWGNVSSTSNVADMNAFVGGAVSSSARGTCWSGANDADASNACDRDHDTAACIKMLTEGTPTLNAEADFTSFSGNDFNLSWGTTDGTARQVCAFVIGAAGGGGPAANPKGVFGLALDGPMRRVVY